VAVDGDWRPYAGDGTTGFDGVDQRCSRKTIEDAGFSGFGVYRGDA
jgi:hypothetical protein